MRTCHPTTSKRPLKLQPRLTPLGREHARNRDVCWRGWAWTRSSPRLWDGSEKRWQSWRNTCRCRSCYDDRLKEWSAGDWSGELHADIANKWPAEWSAWETDRYHFRSPGGENFVDLTDRARSFLDDFTESGERVAIIAHGFLNRAFATVLLGLSPAEMMRINQTNDTVIRIVSRDGVVVADHFVGGDGPARVCPKCEVVAAVGIGDRTSRSTKA